MSGQEDDIMASTADEDFESEFWDIEDESITPRQMELARAAEREKEIDYLLQKMSMTCPMPPRPPKEAAVPVAQKNLYIAFPGPTGKDGEEEGGSSRWEPEAEKQAAKWSESAQQAAIHSLGLSRATVLAHTVFLGLFPMSAQEQELALRRGQNAVTRAMVAHALFSPLPLPSLSPPDYN